jgi:4-aminobutyrate aminotransferase-like enzyme
MEYFNTFGGNSVGCIIADAVLDVIISENLQHNAKITGDYLLSKLNMLKDKYPNIGDVRGVGLFLGIEFIHCNSNEILESNRPEPNYELAKNIVDMLMQDMNIISSRDGNVIKIKPPLVFGVTESDLLVDALERSLISQGVQNNY